MSICKGCGKEIVWGVTPDGKRIPLDPRPPVYSILPNQPEDGDMQVVRDHNASVSHFATCTKANDFSSSTKRPETAKKAGAFNFIFGEHPKYP